MLQLWRRNCFWFDWCYRFKCVLILRRGSLLMGRIKFLCLLPRGLLHRISYIKNMCGVHRRSLCRYTWSFNFELLLCLRHG